MNSSSDMLWVPLKGHQCPIRLYESYICGQADLSAAQRTWLLLCAMVAKTAANV